MPQMSPMMWTLLVTLFIIYSLIYMNNFPKMKMKTLKSTKIMSKQNKMKW